MPYGYLVHGGYMGRMKNGQFILFPTEDEYIEIFTEQSGEE